VEELFCGGCGSHLPQFNAAVTPRPASGNAAKISWIGILLFILVFIVIAVNNTPTPTEVKPLAAQTDAPAQTPSSPSIPIVPTVKGPPTHAMGEAFAVGYWAYRCNGMRWTPVIGSGFNAERANADFLVVDIEVQNQDVEQSSPYVPVGQCRS
jgi:hypothetical protein